MRVVDHGINHQLERRHPVPYGRGCKAPSLLSSRRPRSLRLLQCARHRFPDLRYCLPSTLARQNNRRCFLYRSIPAQVDNRPRQPCSQRTRQTQCNAHHHELPLRCSLHRASRAVRRAARDPVADKSQSVFRNPALGMVFSSIVTSVGGRLARISRLPAIVISRALGGSSPMAMYRSAGFALMAWTISGSISIDI